MIFYLKYKNKKIVELDVDLTLEHFKITDYKILSSNLSNIFENLNLFTRKNYYRLHTQERCYYVK